MGTAEQPGPNGADAAMASPEALALAEALSELMVLGALLMLLAAALGADEAVPVLLSPEVDELLHAVRLRASAPPMASTAERRAMDCFMSDYSFGCASHEADLLGRAPAGAGRFMSR
ncbi:MAG: hypothetical protein ACTHNT_06815 [Actinomycetales bacterium]